MVAVACCALSTSPSTSAAAPVPGLVTSFGSGGTIVYDTPDPVIEQLGFARSGSLAVFGRVDGNVAGLPASSLSGGVEVVTGTEGVTPLDARGVDVFAGIETASPHRLMVARQYGGEGDPYFGDHGKVWIDADAHVGTVHFSIPESGPPVAAALHDVGGVATAFVAMFGYPFGANGIVDVDLGPGPDEVIDVQYVGNVIAVVGRANGEFRAALRALNGDVVVWGGHADGVGTLPIPTDAVITAVGAPYGLVVGGHTAAGQPFVQTLNGASPVLLSGLGTVGAIGTSLDGPNGFTASVLRSATTLSMFRFDEQGTPITSWGLGGEATAAVPSGASIVRSGFNGRVVEIATGDSSVSIEFAGDGHGSTATTHAYEWKVPASDVGTAATVRADGSIVFGGWRQTGDWLAALSPTGAPLTSFGTNGSLLLSRRGTIDAIRPLSDGSMLVAFNSSSQTTLVRITAAGAVDTSYGDQGQVPIPMRPTHGLLVTDDGTALVVGDRGYRVGPTGVIDPTWGVITQNSTLVHGDEQVVDVRSGSDGVIRVIIASGLGGITQVRLQANGDLEPSSSQTIFGGSFGTYGARAATLSNGRVAVLSTRGVVNNTQRIDATAFDENAPCCSPPRQLQLSDPYASPLSIVATPDGGLLVLWSGSTSGGVTKVRGDMSIDRGFGIDGTISVSDAKALAIGASGVAAAVGGRPGSHGYAATVTAMRSDVPPVSAASRYVPFATPVRVVDTRGGAPLEALEPRSFALTGTNGIPANATALAVNFTLTEAIGPGFGQVFGTGFQYPGTASNVNLPSNGGTVSGFAAVRIGLGGAVSVASSTPSQAIIDVFGYWVPADTATSGRFVAAGLAGRRVFDSRQPSFGRKPLNAGQVATVATQGTGMAAAVVNITVTQPDAPGWLAAFSTVAPSTSNLNFVGGETRPNLVLAPLNANGSFRIVTSARTHVIVDVVGYITGNGAASSSSGLFHAESQSRIVDTRLSGQGGSLSPGGVRAFTVSGASGVDGTAVAALVNVTTTNTKQAGYINLRQSIAAADDGTSTVNVAGAGGTASNAAVVTLGAGGFAVFSSAGGDVILDVAGWFST